jgi:hypothetical protein
MVTHRFRDQTNAQTKIATVMLGKQSSIFSMAQLKED